MNAKTLMPKQFIGGADVHDVQGKSISINAVISSLKKVKVGDDVRWALTFEGTDRKLALNTTNNDRLIELFGAETDDWIGQKISLYGEETKFQGKRVQAVRIDEPAAGAKMLGEGEVHFDAEEVPV